MSRHRDPNTLDMFSDWQLPQVYVTLPPEVATGGNLSSQIARAVSRALKASDLSREQIADAMSEYLGEEFSKNMLDVYASEARESHRITLERFVALIHVTNQHGLLGFVAEQFGLVVVPERYSDLIEWR
ncbi:hypothetical protein [Ruegeria arenilitoris]|uniref:hypothetical protein n=1 Tax=Ruegeria arenilitoris TaxID=1173585 RepID=UPI00147DF1E8|nr:hypothetical protein [Ruegeria arenilitoris]